MVYGILLSWLVSCSLLGAQTLELRAEGRQPLKESGAGRVVAVDRGEPFVLSIRADLSALRAAGIGFYLALPAGFFAVEGERPFVQGGLFAGAVEFANEIMPQKKAVGIPADIVLLPYAAVMGPGSERGRAGSGEVARLLLRPLRSGTADIAFVHSPIYPGKLVAEDGVGEYFFSAMEGLKILVRADHSGKAAAEGDEGWAAIKRRVLIP